ncbi:type VI secretion system Vgr family protein [Serratia sp. D1N4]
MLSRTTAHTPLPSDELLFWSLQGEERLSSPYAFCVELLSKNPRIDRQALLGKSVTLAIPSQYSVASRFLNGKVTSVAIHSETINDDQYAVYKLRLEPDVWPMLRDRNCRIFQQQTVPQIITALLRENQVSVENLLTRDYRLWEYCVQYQESSFNFISRLMELEGIYYFFRHEMNKNTLVLIDAPQRHQPFSGYEQIDYHATPSGGIAQEEGINQWLISDAVTPGIYSIDDYDFRKPNAWLFQARQNPVSPQPGQIDVFDWPGHFVEHQQGEAYARVRQEAWQAEHQQISGSGTALGIVPGCTFVLNNAPYSSDASNYLVTRATYFLRDNPYASGETKSEQHFDFTVIPANVPFRPPQQAPWPKTSGPQTAKVVGPQGKSIWTDKYGRVKVKFHWDRLSAGDDTSSCWVRVSSAWAGQGFGGIQIPRAGDEVIVDFINGDPDRPIITGRVFNEASMPPWELPAAATQMGFMSRSEDGTPENSNALRFEDKAGSEQVLLHAERNMDTDIENEETHSVGSNRTKTVSGNETSHIKQDRTKSVDGNETSTIKGNETLSVSGNRAKTVTGDETASVQGARTQTVDQNESLTVKADRSLTVQGADSRSITGNHTQTVGGAKTEQIDQAASMTIGQSLTESVGTDLSLSVGGARSVAVTGNQVSTIGGENQISVTGGHSMDAQFQQVVVKTDALLSAGGNSTIDATGVLLSAKNTITLQCGAASISLTSDGKIILSGVDITSAASGDHLTSGSKITSSAAGDHVVEGALLKLNP